MEERTREKERKGDRETDRAEKKREGDRKTDREKKKWEGDRKTDRRERQREWENGQREREIGRNEIVLKFIALDNTNQLCLFALFQCAIK